MGGVPCEGGRGSATGVSVRECRNDGIVEVEWELGERMRRRRGLRIRGALAELRSGEEVMVISGEGGSACAGRLSLRVFMSISNGFKCLVLLALLPWGLEKMWFVAGNFWRRTFRREVGFIYGVRSTRHVWREGQIRDAAISQY